jgi:hypothetical protein
MKYSQWIGILAVIALCIACFFPLAYYPDLNKYFTGFFSEQNMYGRPGKLFMILGAVAILFFALNKLWAKRANWLVCAIIAAYAVKNFILFTACYRGICPVKQPAVYIMLIAPIIMLIAAFLPKVNNIPTAAKNK